MLLTCWYMCKHLPTWSLRVSTKQKKKYTENSTELQSHELTIMLTFSHFIDSLHEDVFQRILISICDYFAIPVWCFSLFSTMVIRLSNCWIYTEDTSFFLFNLSVQYKLQFATDINWIDPVTEQWVTFLCSVLMTVVVPQPLSLPLSHSRNVSPLSQGHFSNHLATVLHKYLFCALLFACLFPVCSVDVFYCLGNSYNLLF